MTNEMGLTEHADEVLLRFSEVATLVAEAGIDERGRVAHAFTMGMRIALADPDTAREIARKLDHPDGNMGAQEQFVLNGAAR